MPKPAPNYWWDFVDNAKYVIVQSDYPGGEMLAKFAVRGGGIEQAERLISDYESGRKTPNWNKP